MRIIPFKEPAQWKEQLQLDGVVFYFVFKWNALNEFWVMDIYNVDELPLILGIKIVPLYNLLEQYTVFGKPRGDIICQNIVGSQDTISRFDMSQKFELIYYSIGELKELTDALEAANAV